MVNEKNTKIYKIVRITPYCIGNGYDGKIYKDKIEFDDYIEYRDGRENWVIVGELSSARDYYFIGAEVIIDLDIAEQRSSESWTGVWGSRLIGSCKREKERMEEVDQKKKEEERALVKRGVEELESLNWKISSLDSAIKAGGEELRRKNTEIDELKNNLEQIKQAFNNKIQEGEQLNQELSALKLENKETKKSLGNSREEVINYTLDAKKIKLETFIQNLRIDRTQVRDLRRAYQQLIQVREENKQDDVNIAKQNIEKAEDQLLDKGISMQNFQSLCRKCEKIVKLEIEQENLYKERFEARQEIVLYNRNR
jgi:chromosome segregation ATPase